MENSNESVSESNCYESYDTTIETILPPISEGTTKNNRATPKDRSNSKYSEQDFLAMPRDEQLKLVEKYWNGPVADFDDGTFQFSYSHFAKLCSEIGFRKGIVDDFADMKEKNDCSKMKIYIEHGTRSDTVEKKFTLSTSTVEALDQLFADSDKTISNIEKSKIIDVVIGDKINELLELKRKGLLSISYKPIEEVKII